MRPISVKYKKYVKAVAFYVSVAPLGFNVDAAQGLDDICQDLAEDIGTDWKKLGRRLSISKANLDSIDLENPPVSEKSIAMLNKWRENSGKKATVKALTEALKKMRRKDILGMNNFSSFYPLNSSTFGRKRNCYRLN